MRHEMRKMLEDMALSGSSDEHMRAAMVKVFGYRPTCREVKAARANVRLVRFHVDGTLPNLVVTDAMSRQAMLAASAALAARICADAYERGLKLPNMTREEQLERARRDPAFRL